MADNTTPGAGGQGEPPGWYVDPWGRADQRWWNGFEWTDQTRPAPRTDPTHPARQHQPDEDSEPSSDTAEHRGAKLLAAIVGFGLLFGLLSELTGALNARTAEEDQEVETPAEEPEPVEDDAEVAAVLACTHYINVYRDARDGILTESEVREKLVEVELDARVSDEPGIAEGARELLSVATQGGDLQEPSDRFVRACEDAGAFDD